MSTASSGSVGIKCDQNLQSLSDIEITDDATDKENNENLGNRIVGESYIETTDGATEIENDRNLQNLSKFETTNDASGLDNDQNLQNLSDIETTDGVAAIESDQNVQNLSDIETSDEYVPNTSESSSSDSEQAAAPEKRSRWKKSNPQKWKVNEIVNKRKSGLPYKSKTGRMQNAKKPKQIDCSNCRYKCTANLDFQFRETVCSEFWQLNYDRQKDFILRCVQSNPPKTQRIRTGTGVRKESSRIYKFTENGKEVRVCKNFFLKTLAISHGPVDKALAGLNDVSGIFNSSDMRGRKEPGNKTAPELIAQVKSHIESFPTMGSHHCRKSTKRKYLDSTLSISKMYDLYLEKCRNNGNEKHVSQITYRRIFCQNYNLSFFQPKKDQCLICENFEKNKNDPHKAATLKAEYEAHIRRRDEANMAKAADKSHAGEVGHFVSATFDLQSVLQIPCSEVSQMYYSRKLCAYNLTV